MPELIPVPICNACYVPVTPARSPNQLPVPSMVRDVCMNKLEITTPKCHDPQMMPVSPSHIVRKMVRFTQTP